MILVIDVGNTNITFGVYEGKKLVTTFRMMSKLPHTSDEYGMSIRQLLMFDGISKEQIEGTILASVVPNIMHSLVGGITRYLGTPPLIVGAGTKTGIRIITESPKYGGPVLVLDFGTATTYDYVTADGCFAAGITAPGIRISAKALWEDTARLPVVEIKKPKSILAQETISSMQAGLVYGQIGQTEYIVNAVKKETGLPDMKVVATGGLGRIIADETDVIDIYDAALTMEGLRYIYEKNRR